MRGGVPVKASDESLPESPESSLPESSPVELGDVDAPRELAAAAVVVVVDPGAVVLVVVDPDPVVVVVVLVVDVVDPLAAVNVTVTGSLVRSTLSVVSSAVYVTGSAVVSVTSNKAFPVLVVVPLIAVTTELPPDTERVTTLPGTASPSPL
jgi:hypothetical protein